MILAVDVHYYTEGATTGAVAFTDWPSSQEEAVYVSYVSKVEDYVPGNIYVWKFPYSIHAEESRSNFKGG